MRKKPASTPGTKGPRHLVHQGLIAKSDIPLEQSVATECALDNVSYRTAFRASHRSVPCQANSDRGGTNAHGLRRLLRPPPEARREVGTPVEDAHPTIPLPLRPKYLILGAIFPVIMALDLVTKRWALEALAFERSEVLGGLVPLTLAFNKGAAFGIRLGDDSRWFFVPVTIVALGLLAMLFRQAADRDFLRIVSISLVVSGAIGNLYDRVRWSRGVIDFIGPIDLGLWNFPIFNVADMAITCGAVLLALSFWFEEQEERNRASAAAPAVPGGEPSA